MQTPIAAQPALLNRRQLATALQLSERTLFDLTKSNVIPSIRIGSRIVRYDLDNVRAALAGKEPK